MVRVVELSQEWESPWDEFVAAHPGGLLYHSLAFRDFLVDLLGCRQRYALAVDEHGAVTGAVPLLVADGPHGEVLNSLPYYGSPGGPLALSDDAARALTDWYAKQITKPSVAAATMVENVFSPSPLPVPHDVTDSRMNHTTDLRGLDTDEHLAGAIEASARRNVKKAVRAGVDVAVENDNLGDLEELHVRSMRLAGGAAKSAAFFAAVAEHFRPDDDFRIYVARVDGRPAACLLLFYFAGTVEYYVPAVDPDHRSLQPLAAILARAMPDAARRGSHRWNWGGSWPGHDSLMRFKAKWGGRAEPYTYWVKVNSAAVTNASPQALLGAYPGFYVRPFHADNAPAGAAS
jgi:Acetyltransferase (GNAT) domain